MEKNIEPVLKELDEYKKHVTGAWIIMYNGTMLQLISGKSVWAKQNHAGSALNNFLSVLFPYRRREELNNLGFKNIKELKDYLLQRGIIEIKKL